MNFYTLVFLIFIVVAGCSSSKKLSSNSAGVLAYDLSGFDLTIDTPWVNEESQAWINSSALDSIADARLEQIVLGYKNSFTNSYSVAAEHKNADIIIKIKKITVKKGGITLNFTHPGPLLKIVAEADVFQNGEFLFTDTYSTTKNMSEEYKKEFSFYVLKEEQKQSAEAQILTLKVAFSEVFGQIPFKLVGAKI